MWWLFISPLFYWSCFGLTWLTPNEVWSDDFSNGWSNTNTFDSTFHGFWTGSVSLSRTFQVNGDLSKYYYCNLTLVFDAITLCSWDNEQFYMQIDDMTKWSANYLSSGNTIAVPTLWGNSGVCTSYQGSAADFKYQSYPIKVSWYQAFNVPFTGVLTLLCIYFVLCFFVFLFFFVCLLFFSVSCLRFISQFTQKQRQRQKPQQTFFFCVTPPFVLSHHCLETFFFLCHTTTINKTKKRKKSVFFVAQSCTLYDIKKAQKKQKNKKKPKFLKKKSKKKNKLIN